MQGPYDILTIGLVIFTVAGTGLLIGWLIPVLPTAVAAAARHTIEIERRLKLATLRTDHDELHRLNMGRKLDDTSYRRLTRQIDLMETAASHPQEA